MSRACPLSQSLYFEKTCSDYRFGNDQKIDTENGVLRVWQNWAKYSENRALFKRWHTCWSRFRLASIIHEKWPHWKCQQGLVPVTCTGTGIFRKPITGPTKQTSQFQVTFDKWSARSGYVCLNMRTYDFLGLALVTFKHIYCKFLSSDIVVLSILGFTPTNLALSIHDFAQGNCYLTLQRTRATQNVKSWWISPTKWRRLWRDVHVTEFYISCNSSRGEW